MTKANDGTAIIIVAAGGRQNILFISFHILSIAHPPCMHIHSKEAGVRNYSAPASSLYHHSVIVLFEKCFRIVNLREQLAKAHETLKNKAFEIL